MVVVSTHKFKNRKILCAMHISMWHTMLLQVTKISCGKLLLDFAEHYPFIISVFVKLRNQD